MKSKPEAIYINLSSSFMYRTVCKFCGEKPSIYYRCKRNFEIDIDNLKKHFSWIRNYYRRLCSDDHLIDEPSSFEGFGFLNHDIVYNKYNPVLHHKTVKLNDEYIEYVCCECGKSVWAFYNKSAKNRPDISNRKCRINYPKKLVY